MRFTTALVAALPLLVAADDVLEPYKAQFQNFLGSLGAMLPDPNVHDADEAAALRAGPKKMHVITQDNWRETLYEPVKEGATEFEEFWIFTTGRNKTCYGHCDRVEGAFNETAERFALLPDAPHMGLLNCENQPVLCHIWGAGTGNLWIFEMLPPPAEISIYKKRFNLTAATSDDFVALWESKSREGLSLTTSYWHPFDGLLAQYHLAAPFGYVVYYFNQIPQWMFMLVVSLISRNMMTGRMERQIARREGQPGAGAAPAPAAAR